MKYLIIKIIPLESFFAYKSNGIILYHISYIIDEGMPNGPSIFAYLVFGSGRAFVEEITRPIR
jgi:hypothetical protein